MALIAGQTLVQMAGLVITIDSDDVTGKIAQFTLTNNGEGARQRTLTYIRNRNPRTVTVQPGEVISFVPPQNGVKWLTDEIVWWVA